MSAQGLSESWPFSRSQFFSLEVGDNAALLGKKKGSRRMLRGRCGSEGLRGEGKMGKGLRWETRVRDAAEKTGGTGARGKHWPGRRRGLARRRGGGENK